MTDLLIFNDADDLLCALSNNSEKSLVFWDADFAENLNQASFLDFNCRPKHGDSRHIEVGNQVAFKDKDGFFRLFRIESTEKEINRQGEYIKARCEDAVLELATNILTDIRPQNVTMRFALERALSGQARWEVGEVADLGVASTNYFYISSIEAVERCLKAWGAELRVRIETDGRRITRRLVDAVSRGRDTGLQMEVGHNVDGLSLTVETGHVRTLMYGRGAGIPMYDDSGTATGGYSRSIMFTDLVATNASHGFVKPRGQPYLVDNNSRELYGLINPQTGQREHLEGVYENGTVDDADTLMLLTWEHLQHNNRPHYHAICDLVLLAELLGEDYDHEQLRLGDVVRLVDHETFTTPITIETRVIGITYDVANPDNATVEMGDFRNLYSDSERLNNIEYGLNNGMWQRPPVIGPGNIANRTPQQVTGFEAFGGFSQIHLMWNHQGLLVRDFELHGSEVEGFMPGDSNLIYRGAVAAFSHQVEPNRRWYYRCRAVNYHDVRGPWSIEVNAQTANTFGLDQLEGTLNTLNDETIPALKESLEAKEAQLGVLNNVTLPGLESRIESNRININTLNTVTLPGLTARLTTAETSLSAAQVNINRALAEVAEVESLTSHWRYRETVEIDGGTIRANTVEANRILAGSITTVQIQAGSIVGGDLAVNTITAREITANAITASEIASDAIITRHISTNAITANEISANAITASEIASDAIITRHIATNAVTANEIAVGTITAAEIAAGTITALQVAAETITANQLAINTITANRIASNAIIARHITAGIIVADHIASGAITSTHISVGTLNGNRIQTNTMHGNRITANTITADHLTSNAIQVGFNAIGRTIQISSTRLSFYDGGEEIARMTSSGLQYWRGDRDIGRIIHSQMLGNPAIRGLGLRAQPTGDYVVISHQGNATGTNPAAIQMLFDPHGNWTGASGHRRPGIHVTDRLFVTDMATRSATRMDFSVLTMTIGGLPRVFIGTNESTATRTGIAFGAGQVFVIRNNASTQI